MKTLKKQKRFHEPVMQTEVVEALQIKKFALLNNQGRFIDATVAMAGHSVEIIKSAEKLLGIDMDLEALEIAERRLKKACPASQKFKDTVVLVNSNFKDIANIAKKHEFANVDGILFDLGVSTKQLTSTSSGMSFAYPQAPLDMRINQDTLAVKASDLLNGLREDQLMEMFSRVLTKGSSKRLSRRVVEKRKKQLYKTVGDFLEVIEKNKRQKLHPATLPFLALRIHVNSELENLREALTGAFELLKPEGRLVVISFHSAEDSIVKEFNKRKVYLRQAKIVNKKPIRPRPEEVKKNPKARSAKMRILEKSYYV